MRLSRRVCVALALGASMAVAATGCGNGGDDTGGPSEPTGGPAPSATTPAAPERLGGADTGFSIELPDGWVRLDLTADDLVADALAAGLPDELAETFPQIAGQIADLGGFFAVDVPSTNRLGGRFAGNGNGYCGPGMLADDVASMEGFTRQQLEGVGATDVATSLTTIGTTDAVRVTYLLSTGPRPVQGVQFAFFGAGEQSCFLTFSTTPEDEDLARFDAIADTVQLS
jgi:hypothetical protein